MQNSFKALHASKIDLMQIRSLKDWQTHSMTLRDMKVGKSVHSTLDRSLRTLAHHWLCDPRPPSLAPFL